MKRVYVNEEWCLGCHLCEYNCAFANSKLERMAALKGKKIFPRIHVEGDDRITFAVSCRHCTDPICVKSCIAGAISKVDGVVKIDKPRQVRRVSDVRSRLPVRRAPARRERNDAEMRALPLEQGGQTRVRDGLPERRDRL